MPISEISKVDEATDGGYSPVADAIGLRWGLAPGSARWHRSSASHVFFVAEAADHGAYLRFVPDCHRTYQSFAGVAALMGELAERRLRVARPIKSLSGGLVETVHTGLGPMHAMLVEAVVGEQLDVEDISTPHARAWGAALARLHHDSAGLGERLPQAVAWLRQLPELCSDDPVLAAAVAGLAALLEDLPRDPAGFGIVHGDFELDNMGWSGLQLTAYDFDEAGWSWYAGDIAYAVRDLTDATGIPTSAHVALFDGFIGGYRTVRPLDQADVDRLPLFSALNAARDIASIRRAMDVTDLTGAPAWQVRLSNSLEQAARLKRRIILDFTG